MMRLRLCTSAAFLLLAVVLFFVSVGLVRVKPARIRTKMIFRPKTLASVNFFLVFIFATRSVYQMGAAWHVLHLPDMALLKYGGALPFPPPQHPQRPPLPTMLPRIILLLPVPTTILLPPSIAASI
jgi:hypothetical protein